MQIVFNVNQRDVTLEIEPSEILLDVLREKLHLHSVKRGCGTGDCGACTVLLDGDPITSCSYLAVRADGKRIITLEGLGTPQKLHPLQRHFKDTAAFQCGFCAPGMILTAKALLDKNPHPTEEEIRGAIYGNLCRCSGYVNIVKAIQNAADEGLGNG